MDQVAEVVADIEEEKARGLVSGIQVFRSMLNQPALVSVNSANATSVSSQNGFSTFTVNMPRPLLEVNTLQLLNAVIPLPTTNIPDTACGFWYYRLSAYKGLAPNTDNLFFNRLLPSYYKPEYLTTTGGIKFGQNQTFNTYADAAAQMAIASSNDLAFTNITTLAKSLNDPSQYLNPYRINYMPNDAIVTYNSGINKFQLTGNNVSTVFATQVWSSGTTYALNDLIYYTSTHSYPATQAYKSLQDGNINHNPAAATTWWVPVYTDIVQPYDNDTLYRKGSIVYTSSPYNQMFIAMWDIRASGGPLGVTTSRVWTTGTLYWTNDWVTVGSGGAGYICVQPNAEINPSGVGAAGFWVSEYWSSTTTYNQGQYIFYATTNRWYKSLIPNNLNNAPTNTNAWELLGTNGQSWTTYAPTTQNPNYRYLSAGFNDPNVALNQGTSQRQWSPYSLYEVNDYVSYGGFDYYCIFQNRNFPPFQPAANTTAWSSTQTYSIGQTVLFTPQNWGAQYVYLCIKANTGQVPSYGSAFWSQQIWATSTTQWNPVVYYNFGDLVKYGNKYYQRIVAGRGGNPTSSPDWRERLWITGAAPFVGLNTISTNLDMLDIYTTGGSAYVSLPFPEGIVGQPFNPVPRRILNSILGFTWNGQIPDPSVLQPILVLDPVVGPAYFIGNTAVTLYNRVRPVPPYVVLTGAGPYGEELDATPSTTATTYTAEGYANLVYTSVVSIYSTIVCGSTVNTQRNTNLLGIANMNAGNLGVAYYQNIIDDALKLYQNDIYTITMELRDEMDEPYYLTNNAVCSFTMKLTYKE